MTKYVRPLGTLAWVLVSTSAASAAGFAPLNSFTTQVVTWAQDIGMIAFIGILAMVVFAHDHLTSLFGSLTRAVVGIGLLVTGGTWLGSIGIAAAAGGGAWFR
jgi:hypothetical protein